MKNLKQKLSPLVGKIKKYYPKYKKFMPYIASALAVCCIYFVSNYLNKEERVYHQKESVSLEGGRIVDDGKHIYKMKETIISRRMTFLENLVKELGESIHKINQKLDEQASQVQSPSQANTQEAPKEQNVTTPNNEQPVTFSGPTGSYDVSGVSQTDTSYQVQRPRRVFKRKPSPGPSTISFPVQLSESKKEMTIKVPAGSYLKAKLLTGVEASESRPVPVLLQADYFFVGPNKSKIDLSGCFIIAKSQGNLSIERVEMQTNKISCVSKSGKMFERELNGFVADGNDSSFGITGVVNSKQSRVASMAFLSSVVQGIGTAIQQAQTSTQTNALGGSSSVISGDQAKYMAAGGVSNAASLVTNWYLQHAQNLLPTINIGSGQDVWLIVQDTVELPNWYFAKPKKASTQGSFSYLSRLID